MTHIQIRGDLAATWASIDPVLMEREMGVETDTLLAKYGDGVSAWTDLDYAYLSVEQVGEALEAALDGLAPLDSPAFIGVPTAPIPSLVDASTAIATTGWVQAIVATAVSDAVAALTDTLHPINSLYFTTTNVSPATFIGGTWESFGTGRVLVGVDPAQTEFDTAGETGGEKTHVLTTAEMPAHSHPTYVRSASGPSGTAVGLITGAGGDMYANSGAVYAFDSPGTPAAGPVGTRGSSGAHNNLQPYITGYMWKRTA